MPASMTAFRDEHRELLPEITALRTTADSIGSVAPDELALAVADRLRFLDEHLRPHALAEDEVLYPEVARVMGSADSTATMRRDHVGVMELTEELQRMSEALHDGLVDDRRAADLRRVLYGLFAVVSLHFAKEEEVYLPLLEERMTPDEAEAMFRAMGVAHQRFATPDIAHQHH